MLLAQYYTDTNPEMMAPVFSILVLVAGIVVALAALAFFPWVCSKIAAQKNRSVGGWAIAGFFFGIFAFCVIVALEPIPELRRPTLRRPLPPGPPLEPAYYPPAPPEPPPLDDRALAKHMLDRGLLSRDALKQCAQYQQANAGVRLGDALVQLGIMSVDQVRQAIRDARQDSSGR